VGNVLLGAYRFLQPHIWSAAKTLGTESLKALGREAFRTGKAFAYDLVENPRADLKGLVSKHADQNTQNLVRKLRGGCRRRRRPATRKKEKKATKSTVRKLKGGGVRKKTKKQKTHCKAKSDPQKKNYKTRHFFNIIIYSAAAAMAKVTEYVGSEFDVFREKPVQTGTLDTIPTWYHPIASVSQSDLEFLIPGDSETYVDTLIRLYVRGRLTKADGTDLDNTDYTALVNNALHSFFSQCNISLNDVASRRPVTFIITAPTWKPYSPTVLTPPKHTSQMRTGI
jgi:hypothetical protein